MPAVCPRSSVEYRTAGRSGFQMRSVRSIEPVAINWPAGFHASVRRLFTRKNRVSSCFYAKQEESYSRMRPRSFRRRIIVVLCLSFVEDKCEMLFREKILARGRRHQ